jgi:tetratricopeptide (TPR) repeat protein
MMRRPVPVPSALRALAIIAGAAALFTGSASAQLARPRTAAPDAPKLLVMPFEFGSGDSTVALLVADGTRDRLRSNHLTKFNTIPRNILNENLVNSGFPTDVPLDNAVKRQLAQFLNARYTIDGTLLRRGTDSVLVLARLQENVRTRPQSVTASVIVPRTRASSGTGGELANRLVDGYNTFDDVRECRTAVEARNWARAVQKANDAIRQFPAASSAYLCLADVKRGQEAPQDTILAVLLRAVEVDSLNSLVLRQLAAIYEQRGDTTNLIVTLRRILVVDERENELRIGLARLMVLRSMTDSAVVVIDEGLAHNPNSAELLNAKAVALGAAGRWAGAADALEHVAEIDSMLIDSSFANRITNYLRQVPDSARLFTWLQVITYRHPLQAPYWFALGELAFARGDTAGAVRAADEYVKLRPTDARGHLAAARYELAGGVSDSALAHLEQAVADSAMRPFAAPLYLQLGLAAYRDSNWTVAEERLGRAREYAQGRAVVPAAFFLGLSQVQLGVRADNDAQTGSNCEAARRSQTLFTNAEQNIIAGAAQNRDAANQLLSQVIPAYKQRSDALIRNFCR